MYTNRKIAGAARGQQGYMLLTLTLAVALIVIASLTALPPLVQQVQREREEELCHRGTQYMRAIKRYYRAMGRYPTRLEDLENTNNMRFIRRLYKDPMHRDPKTGQEADFRILHLQDVMTSSGGLALKGSSATLSSWQNVLSGNAEVSDSSDSTEPPEGADQNSPEPKDSDSSKVKKESSDASSNTLSEQSFGDAILGVASASKERTIREFNNKKHYNDWYFIYDASMNMPGPLVGPWQPAPSIRADALSASSGSNARPHTAAAGEASQNAPSLPPAEPGASQ